MHHFGESGMRMDGLAEGFGCRFEGAAETCFCNHFGCRVAYGMVADDVTAVPIDNELHEAIRFADGDGLAIRPEGKAARTDVQALVARLLLGQAKARDLG